MTCLKRNLASKKLLNKNKNFEEGKNSTTRSEKTFGLNRVDIISRFDIKNLRFGFFKNSDNLFCNKSENKPEKHPRNRTQPVENCQLRQDRTKEDRKAKGYKIK